MPVYAKLAAWGSLALALAWVGSIQLKPLGSLLSGTQEMLSTTRAILSETQSLKAGITRVQRNMKQLERQELLLQEQEQLTVGILAELERQERLNGESLELLGNILEAERATVGLTKEADRAGAVSIGRIRANSRELDRLLLATRRIEQASHAMDERLADLLLHMQGSADNFLRVGQVKSASAGAMERTGNWVERLKGWFGW